MVLVIKATEREPEIVKILVTTHKCTEHRLSEQIVGNPHHCSFTYSFTQARCLYRAPAVHQLLYARLLESQGYQDMSHDLKMLLFLAPSKSLLFWGNYLLTYETFKSSMKPESTKNTVSLSGVENSFLLLLLFF